MPLSLTELRRAAADHIVQADECGFNIERQDLKRDAFNRLVREAIDSAGLDFVAFPQTDGHRGYSSLYVIPLAQITSDAAT